MQTVLIVIHLMIVLALVGIVLIQRSEGGGLGIGGGSGFMSARGTANALTPHDRDPGDAVLPSPRSALVFLPATRRNQPTFSIASRSPSRVSRTAFSTSSAAQSRLRRSLPFGQWRSVCRRTGCECACCSGSCRADAGRSGNGHGSRRAGSGSHHAGSPSGGPEQGSVRPVRQTG